MLERTLTPTLLTLSRSAQDTVIWGYLDQGLVHLNHRIPWLTTGYLKLTAQTPVAFANTASTIAAAMCLAWAFGMLGWMSDATRGR